MKILSKLFKTKKNLVTSKTEEIITNNEETQGSFSEEFYERLKNININSIDTNRLRYIFNKGKVSSETYTRADKFVYYRDINPAYYKKFLKIKNKINKLSVIDEDMSELIRDIFNTVENYDDCGIISYDKWDEISHLEMLINRLARRVEIELLPIDRMQKELNSLYKGKIR